jgi:hypothetical protein
MVKCEHLAVTNGSVTSRVSKKAFPDVPHSSSVNSTIRSFLRFPFGIVIMRSGQLISSFFMSTNSIRHTALAKCHNESKLYSRITKGMSQF